MSVDKPVGTPGLRGVLKSKRKLVIAGIFALALLKFVFADERFIDAATKFNNSMLAGVRSADIGGNFVKGLGDTCTGMDGSFTIPNYSPDSGSSTLTFQTERTCPWTAKIPRAGILIPLIALLFAATLAITGGIFSIIMFLISAGLAYLIVQPNKSDNAGKWLLGMPIVIAIVSAVIRIILIGIFNVFGLALSLAANVATFIAAGEGLKWAVERAKALPPDAPAAPATPA